MKKKIIFFVCMILGTAAMIAQTNVSGTIKDAKTLETIPGVNIKLSGKAIGTTTDFDGNFSIKIASAPPFFLEISAVGYRSQKVEVSKKDQALTINLIENETSLDEIVISASRTPERVMESPVTVERMDIREIKNTSAPSFYEGLENLKGVDVNTNSLTFKSVNTRGFAAFDNSRFLQLVDGMDNASPALNFALGNLLGLSELDVKTVELLPGASSALYGANAFNGIMFMTSKSAFEDEGVSVSVKGGVTSQEAAGVNEYVDLGVRLAHAFSEKFAAKATISYLEGTEWHATDNRNTRNGEYVFGSRDIQDYDGLNVYGDEVATNLGGAVGRVSRTGYDESDLMNYEARSLKAGVSFNFRPFDDDRLEFIWNSKVGVGNTIFQGANRYSIKDFVMQQHKFEVKGKNFFVRSYLTSEDAGNSYDSRFTAININRRWKSDEDWFTEYAGAYLSTGSHEQARAVADTGRFLPGTKEFDDALREVTADSDLVTGSRFQDNTKLYHSDVNYNLRDHISWAEFQVGGSYRRYSLNSQGSIFTDNDGPIDYDEFGMYTQMQKKFLEDDRLKLTTSIRYDKAQNFDGNFSPRVSLAYAAGENKNQNFRASFQTGFRNPTTQDQYIGLDVGRAFLVGSASDNLDRYTTPELTVSGAGQQILGGATTTLTGRSAYENAFSLTSVEQFSRGEIAAPINANVGLVKPEKVTAFEVGYRGIVPVTKTNRVAIDLSVYYNTYQDFIANKNVIVPYYGDVNLSQTVPIDANGNTAPLALIALNNDDFKAFQTYTNSSADVNSYGTTIGLNTRVFNNFDLGVNYTFSKFDFDQASDPDFQAGFNTPEHKFKVQFGKQKAFKNFGFNVNARWQDAYRWESTFHNGNITERTVIDAQINYTMPKHAFKLGGANLTGQEYLSAPGVGAIGSQYYLSWTYNN